MDNKAELLRIAAELKSTADKLIECAKEKPDGNDDEGGGDKEDSKSNKPDRVMMGMILKKKMGKY